MVRRHCRKGIQKSCETHCLRCWLRLSCRPLAAAVDIIGGDTSRATIAAVAATKAVARAAVTVGPIVALAERAVVLAVVLPAA
jgi:hypothetical protein